MDPSNVPAARNGAERLVFAQLYETLIDVDCEGRPRPALARSWTVDATGTRVTLTIREDVRFWSGARLTAGDVVAAWRATAAQPSESGRLARQIADATTILDDRTLTVSLPDTAWLVLADRALAVYRSIPHVAGWPEGSGSYRPATDSMTAGANRVLLAPRSPTAPYLMIRRAAGDARDAIDAGSDVLVTGDPGALSYAASQPRLAVVPLPWTRTYLLVAPRSTGNAGSWAGALPDSALPRIRDSMARDAVRADARAAPAAAWSNALASCRGPANGSAITTPASRGAGRVVYRSDDRVAQALAERLVALGGAAAAAGLEPRELAPLLRAGSATGYLIELPHAPLSPCRTLAALHAAAPWLAAPGATLLPLIDVREHAIVRRNGVPARIGWDGTLIFGDPSRPP